MKKNILITATGAVCLMAYAAGSQNPADARDAYAHLQTLVGEWQADTPMGKAHVTYESIAGGSALVERDTMEHMPPMETVFYLDGGRLLLTHYCDLGNQPRLEARAFNPQSLKLDFAFLDATNLASPAASHMHNASFRFIDANHLSTRWEMYENGQQKSVESFEFTRVR
ncbi:MAG TPA: hypothetical protein VH640_31340 [Bryobacteraceae bacterium]